MKFNPLTAAEENLMQVIWKLENPFMKDIMEAYPEPKPHQNTVSTYLKILVEKEFLTTEKVGRIFKYKVSVPFEDFKKDLLRQILATYYNNSPSEILKTMISEKLLKTEDLHQFFEVKTTVTAISKPETEPKNAIAQYIEELTGSKHKKDRKKKNKKDKKKTK